MPKPPPQRPPRREIAQRPPHETEAQRQTPVGRGGAKLEAAIARFGLARAVAGSLAVDVGASTGGFTETLLHHGAERVVAVDSGTDQLHARLRADPRVQSFERTNWKTLPLDVAPGPFDFFSVDVSFVAARAMLRSLAFRLRPGAHGVVLVKPQFELEPHRVRGGDVSDPRLRAEALARVRTKAESLGFRVIETIDSPVHGGSGTVEILAHLVFEGRGPRLPAPGERRARPERDMPSRDSTASPRRVELFAIALPGLEEIVAREASGLSGAHDVRTVPGGVVLWGDPALVFEANLRLRTASRVLVRIGEIEARELSDLRRRAGRLAFEHFLPANARVTVRASTTHCRLHHTGALAETLVLAIHDRVKRAARRAPAVQASDDGTAASPEALVLLRGEDDRFLISADASGELLHRRGWREETSRAPLRETLAAGLLALAEWDPATPLVDPFCGAGTLAIEAALFALHRAPGLGRDFACESWPLLANVDRGGIRARAEGAALPAAPAPIVASDADEHIVARARRNAERAGVRDAIRFDRTEIAELRAPRGAGRGLVIANPPWGRRLGDARSARELLRVLGRVLRERFAGWRAAVVLADPGLVDLIGLHDTTVHRVTSGGLRVRLVVGVVGRRT